jgi:peptidoglycan/LPS O-acetylase OafA/YrhL
MSTTPGPRTEGKQLGSGTRLILLGAVLFAIGLVIVVLVDGGTPEGIGVAFMSLAAVPVLAGLALTGSALISRRSRKGKPFA